MLLSAALSWALLGAPLAISRPSACALEPLLGSWVVHSLTLDGTPQRDEEMMGARLTFSADRLTLLTAKQAPFTFALRLETGPSPCAFHLTPLGDGTEPPGWMVFEVESGALKLGFHDNLARRPASFEDGPNMLVLRLNRD